MVFFCPILLLSFITPLWWGSYPIKVSSNFGLVHPSQLLHSRLSVLADDVLGCSVGVVELCSWISDPSNQKANLFGLHSLSLRARFDATAFSNKRLCDQDVRRHISKIRSRVLLEIIPCKKSCRLSQYLNHYPLKRKYYEANALPLS